MEKPGLTPKQIAENVKRYKESIESNGDNQNDPKVKEMFEKMVAGQMTVDEVAGTIIKRK